MTTPRKEKTKETSKPWTVDRVITEATDMRLYIFFCDKEADITNPELVLHPLTIEASLIAINDKRLSLTNVEEVDLIAWHINKTKDVHKVSAFFKLNGTYYGSEIYESLDYLSNWFMAQCNEPYEDEVPYEGYVSISNLCVFKLSDLGLDGRATL